jgi:hypothetical protein
VVTMTYILWKGGRSSSCRINPKNVPSYIWAIERHFLLPEWANIPQKGYKIAPTEALPAREAPLRARSAHVPSLRGPASARLGMKIALSGRKTCYLALCGPLVGWSGSVLCGAGAPLRVAAPRGGGKPSYLRSPVASAKGSCASLCS